VPLHEFAAYGRLPRSRRAFHSLWDANNDLPIEALIPTPAHDTRPHGRNARRRLAKAEPFASPITRRFEPPALWPNPPPETRARVHAELLATEAQPPPKHLTIKVPLHVDVDQRQTLQRWMGATRHRYNKTIGTLTSTEGTRPTARVSRNRISRIRIRQSTAPSRLACWQQ
jgi:hypothetical protein